MSMAAETHPHEVTAAIVEGNLDALNSMSDNSILAAAQRSCLMQEALDSKQYDVAQWLLDKADELGEERVCESWRRVHVAAARGDVETLRAASSEELQRTIVNEGEDVLCVAARHAQVDVVNYLVEERGFDPGKAVEESGSTPLQLTSAEGHVGMIERLVELGVGVNDVDVEGWNAFFYAACRDRVAAMETLLALGCDGAARDRGGRSALHCAAAADAKEAVRLIVDRGVVDPGVGDNGGETALHEAAIDCNAAMIKQLVSLGVHVNSVDDDGWNPLFSAAQEDDAEETIRTLLELGVDRTLQEHATSNTALEIAIRCEQHQNARVLQEYFPIMPQMVQVLLGLRGPTESPLTRFAGHELFERMVLVLVNCLLTGKDDGAFAQLVQDRDKARV